jgi:MFS family permease
MLRPLTTGELLDRSFALYRKNFLLFALLICTPILLLTLAGIVFFFVPLYFATSMKDPVTGGILIFVLAVLAGLAFALVWSVSRGATVLAVSSVYLGQKTRVAECYRRMRGRMWRACAVEIGSALLIGLAGGVFAVPGVLLSSLVSPWLVILVVPLAVVPAIMLAVRWALALPVAMLEDAGFSVAVSRSSDLSSGKRWQIFLIYFLKTVMDYAALYIAYIPMIAVAIVYAAGNHQPPPWVFVLFIPFYATAEIVVTPFAMIAFTLVYYDARVRKEALDLEMLMEGMQIASPASSSLPAAAAAAAGGVALT